VPHDFAVTEDTDRLAFLLHVRHDGDFGRKVEKVVAGPLLEIALVQAGRGDGRAETMDEFHEVLRVQLLAAEHQHEVLQPHAMDIGERRIIDRPQVDAANFRRERGLRRHHLECGFLRAALRLRRRHAAVS